MLGLDISIHATAVPSITNQFHTIKDVGWYYSAPALTFSAFQFMFGKLYSIYPTKIIFLLSVSLFMVSSLICALSPTSLALIIGRALAGFSGAGVISGIFW